MVEGLLLMGCPRLAQRDEQSTLAHVLDISDILIHRVPSSMLLFGPITIQLQLISPFGNIGPRITNKLMARGAHRVRDFSGLTGSP